MGKKNIDAIKEMLDGCAAVGFTRLRGGAPGFFPGGSVEEVKRNIADVLGGSDGPPLPVVIVRITDYNVRQLHTVMDLINTRDSVSSLNGADVVLLREVFPDPDAEDEEGWR